MSYHLRPDRKAPREILRVVSKRLGKARSALTAPKGERARGVHQARKRFKEMRAVLRLVRKPLGKDFDRENQRIRDAARLLSSSRDVTAIVESWDALAATDTDLFQQAQLRAVRKRLASRKPSPASGSEDDAIVEALAAVESLEADMAKWSLKPSGFDLYVDGLQRTYRDGRKALSVAAKDPSAHNLHEWRKRVKDHWYHTRLLLLGWPEHFKLRCALLKELSEMLGDEHDLAMLCLLMEEQPDLFGDETQRERIGAAIDKRREFLQSRALRLGRRLYAESPKALRKRWESYWQLTRRERRSQTSKS
ncbi:CHAD domain-containing protein [Halopseudomonas nanhaiensis]|uniref:CHAD domain-containing protein n=1 Tax=Halopseudomonas nanhaiensis TaxID=2830842 RepID=UPI001CC062C7|nr:CHAD domain-containing protein [Halopseudomonas nanhaiensis]UAW97237.1 CHAD domain-containing protein [Halopseudomonas nanhaiensis]